MVFKGLVFSCPYCLTTLAGERSGTLNTFPNTCPVCEVAIVVEEDKNTLTVYIKRERHREFIRKPFTEVK